jgi:peptidyl-prolyl cis-trans isomerase A (cyclophilin A)
MTMLHPIHFTRCFKGRPLALRARLSQWSMCLLLLWSANSVGADNPQVLVRTSMGDVRVELYADRAPVSVDRFLTYVDSKAYDRTLFHRVIPGFMVQGGGYSESLVLLPEGEPIINEASMSLPNVRGSLAMARGEEIDSASHQFFINVRDNTHLDHSIDSCSREDEQRALKASERGLYRPQTCRSYGYAVFGQVLSGMEVVSRIEQVETRATDDFDDLPFEPVLILSIRRL